MVVSAEEGGAEQVAAAVETMVWRRFEVRLRGGETNELQRRRRRGDEVGRWWLLRHADELWQGEKDIERRQRGRCARYR